MQASITDHVEETYRSITNHEERLTYNSQGLGTWSDKMNLQEHGKEIVKEHSGEKKAVDSN